MKIKESSQAQDHQISDILMEIQQFKTKYSSSIEEYQIGKPIGKGAYAEVRLAIHKSTKHKLAIKIYEKSRMKDSGWKRAVLKEIRILSSLSHPNIIRLYEAFSSES